MNSWEKHQREDRLRRNPGNPSFSSTLLDEIYRSIDEGNDKFTDLKKYKNRNVEKQSNRPSSIGIEEDEDTASLRRACLIEKWMENKISDKVLASQKRQRRQTLPELVRKSKKYEQSDPLFFSSSSLSSSDSSSVGFSSSDADSLGISTTRPKPVRTSGLAQSDKISYNEQSKKNEEDGLMKSKMRALKIYDSLKKVKQPISPGGMLTSFLNSLFTNSNSKNKKKQNDSCAETKKTKSTQTSSSSTTCSSASSYYRSCLSKTSSNSKEKERLNGGVKRTVRFYPVSVIVDEDCRPCGHKCIYENSKKIEEGVRGGLKGYAKKDTVLVRNKNRNQDEEEEEEDDDDAASYSSSDLFELDHLAIIGNNDRYSEELPVYETTYLGRNRAITNGLVR